MSSSNLRPFVPGQSGNPAGRPKGSRHKISEAFVAALCEDFEAHGVAVIARVRTEKPDQYLKVIASILPKDINLKAPDPFADISDERLEQMIQMLDDAINQQATSVADEAVH